MSEEEIRKQLTELEKSLEELDQEYLREKVLIEQKIDAEHDLLIKENESELIQLEEKLNETTDQYQLYKERKDKENINYFKEKKKVLTLKIKSLNKKIPTLMKGKTAALKLSLKQNVVEFKVKIKANQMEMKALHKQLAMLQRY